MITATSSATPAHGHSADDYWFDRRIIGLHFLGKRPRYHHPEDVGRPFVDLTDAHIAINLGHAKLLEVAITAECLERPRYHSLRGSGCEQLCHRGLLQTRMTSVLHCRRVEHQLTGGFKPC